MEIVTISAQQLEALLDSKVKVILEAISQINNETYTVKWFDLKSLIAYLPSKPKPQTVYDWVHKGIIPFYKNEETKSIHFLQSEIDNWLKQARRKTKAEKAADVKNYFLKNP